MSGTEKVVDDAHQMTVQRREDAAVATTANLLLKDSPTAEARLHYVFIGLGLVGVAAVEARLS
jgi:hypothetical protein